MSFEVLCFTDDEVAELQADLCVNSGITHADHTGAQLSTERVPQRIVEHTQSLDRVKYVLVVMQKQVPVQRMVETPQLRFIDRIANDLSNVDRKGSNFQDCEVLFPINRQGPDIAGGVHVGKKDLDDVSVVTQRQIPMIQTVQKTKEIPQLQCVDKVVDNPVLQVPRVQVVEKMVEIPQLQTVEKIAETPQTQTMQGTQIPESLGSAPVCQVAQTGHVEVIENEKPLIQVVPDHETSVEVLMDIETLKSETSGADGQISSLFQESSDVVSQTTQGLSGVCEEKYMSGILGTSGVDRTFRTQGQREHGQRDHVTEEQSKRRARMARQVWVKCGTKTKPLELDDETLEGIERKVRRLVNVNSSEEVYVLCQGKVVQWSKWMEMEEGCIFEVMPPMKGCGKQKKKKEEEDKNPGVTLDETDSSHKEERELTGGEETMDHNDQEQRVCLTEGKGRKRRTWNLNNMREVMAWRRQAVKKVGGMRTRGRKGLRRLT